MAVGRQGRQGSLDGVKERGVREWLGEVDVDPALSGGRPRLQGIVGSDQDHGDGRNMATGVPRHGQAVDPGEPEIGYHQIRPLAVD